VSATHRFALHRARNDVDPFIAPTTLLDRCVMDQEGEAG